MNTSSPPIECGWYEACGLRIQSEIALPGLATASDAHSADVVVRRGPVDAPDRWPASGVAAWPSPEADVVSWAGRARLRLSASEIVIDSENEPFARQCVVGPGLGIVLHRRGRLVLHGSAVAVSGRAVVLLGRKGAGKSTTAAALLARGHSLLTDDLVALDLDGPTVRCAPGPVQMKLWPASADALDLGDQLEPFAEGFAKGVWFGAPAAGRPTPVAMICVLGWADNLDLVPLADSAAFGAAFEHTYAPRFLGAEAARGLVAPTARLSRSVPVYRLERPQRLDRLDDVADQLADTLAALPPSEGRGPVDPGPPAT